MSLLTVTPVKSDVNGTLHPFGSVIKVESIRCFYRRHHNRQGTRITFRDGGGFAVLDNFERLHDTLQTHLPSLPFVLLTQITRHGDEVPTVVNRDAVRTFHPRHEERAGTRITFDDGGGFAVAEPFDQVLIALKGAEESFVVWPVQELQALPALDDDEYDDEEDGDEDE